MPFEATEKIYKIFFNYFIVMFVLSQSAITCSKLTIETLEQGVKYVQS